MALVNGTASNNRLTGTGSADTMYGHAGNDTLFGGGGNDTLFGGTGADSMEGGSGNDVFVVDNAGDRTVELSGQGTDEVRAWVDWTLGANIENLTLFGDAVNGTGNSLNNVLRGNDRANRLDGGAGNDALFGGQGDTLIGGLGNDTLDGFGEMRGGTGDDVYHVRSPRALIVEEGGYDIVYAHVRYREKIYALADGVEEGRIADQGMLAGNGLNNTLVGGVEGDLLMGLSGSDVLRGNYGNDKLIGDGGLLDNDTADPSYVWGNDTLYGGAGDDTLAGELGHDYLAGGDGDDELRYSGSGNDTLFGNGGADEFQFAVWSLRAGTHTPVIRDFALGIDHVDMVERDGSSFSAGADGDLRMTLVSQLGGGRAIVEFDGVSYASFELNRAAHGGSLEGWFFTT